MGLGFETLEDRRLLTVSTDNYLNVNGLDDANLPPAEPVGSPTPGGPTYLTQSQAPSTSHQALPATSGNLQAEAVAISPKAADAVFDGLGMAEASAITTNPLVDVSVQHLPFAPQEIVIDPSLSSDGRVITGIIEPTPGDFVMVVMEIGPDGHPLEPTTLPVNMPPHLEGNVFFFEDAHSGFAAAGWGSYFTGEDWQLVDTLVLWPHASEEPLEFPIPENEIPYVLGVHQVESGTSFVLIELARAGEAQLITSEGETISLENIVPEGIGPGPEKDSVIVHGRTNDGNPVVQIFFANSPEPTVVEIDPPADLAATATVDTCTVYPDGTVQVTVRGLQNPEDPSAEPEVHYIYHIVEAEEGSPKATFVEEITTGGSYLIATAEIKLGLNFEIIAGRLGENLIGVPSGTSEEELLASLFPPGSDPIIIGAYGDGITQFGASVIYTDEHDEFQFATVMYVNDFPLHNRKNPLDVNGDGEVSPLDVLQLINFLNRYGSGEIRATRTDDPSSNGSTIHLVGPDSWFLDVTGSGTVIPEDVLTIINYLNFGPQKRSGYGEPPPAQITQRPTAPNTTSGSPTSFELQVVGGGAQLGGIGEDSLHEGGATYAPGQPGGVADTQPLHLAEAAQGKGQKPTDTDEFFRLLDEQDPLNELILPEHLAL